MVGDRQIGIVSLPSIETCTVSLPTWLWFIKKAKVKVVSDSLRPHGQSMEFSRPEYWSGWNFPSPMGLPDPGIKLGSPALQVDSLPAEP